MNYMKSKTPVDIRSSYGIDVEDQLSKMLSEELAKEIDKSILMGLGIEPDRYKRRKNSINKIFKQ